MSNQKEPVDPDIELLEKFLREKAPPEEIRDQLDIGYRKEGQTVEIFEIRPAGTIPN